MHCLSGWLEFFPWNSSLRNALFQLSEVFLGADRRSPKAAWFNSRIDSWVGHASKEIPFPSPLSHRCNWYLNRYNKIRRGFQWHEQNCPTWLQGLNWASGLGDHMPPESSMVNDEWERNTLSTEKGWQNHPAGCLPPLLPRTVPGQLDSEISSFGRLEWSQTWAHNKLHCFLHKFRKFFLEWV